SRAGVQIDLIVRGMCSLRPGIPEVSENIRVVSLVGRILEHSRIYYFANGGAGGGGMGSADPIQGNLAHRIEVLFPLEDENLRNNIVHNVLPAYLRDTANANILHSDGSYDRVKPAKGEDPFDVQAWFANEAPRLFDPEAPYFLQSTAAPA